MTQGVILSVANDPKIKMAKPKLDKNISIPDNVLTKLLTPSEIRMLKNRWQIIKHLEDGLSIRNVAQKVKVGTDTVVRVARMLEKNNLRKVLDNDRKRLRQIKSSTPWIFGAND